MTIWRMRIACWITKATNTLLEYVIFIAFPLQQYWHYRASMLRYSTLPVLTYLDTYFNRRLSIVHAEPTSF